ncbi:MAG: rhomboid family intramembrane serine protease [Bauldia sp.]|nr:rhomboid family intramembrane serine protease [Bauldia sp.]
MVFLPMNAPFPNPPPPATRQPILNLPLVVSGLIAILFAIHAIRVFLLGSDGDMQALITFAFIPVREIHPEAFAGMALEGARVWSFLTYAFLHGDWGHVTINAVWLAAFGTPLARRFGASRFLLFSAIGAIAGAAAHLAVSPNSLAPMVGASAAISAQMAGASRFVFQTGGPMWGRAGFDAYRRPAAPLGEVVRDRRVLAFLGVWFGINLIFGLTGGAGLAEGAVAWDAHIGGFIAGLLLFPLFDPIPAAR